MAAPLAKIKLLEPRANLPFNVKVPVKVLVAWRVTPLPPIVTEAGPLEEGHSELVVV